MPNTLYYGDNLHVLREYIDDESVDLIYLDPPFNSNASYNVLFRTPTGEASEAQVEAFRDTWSWGEEAERSYDEVMSRGGMTATVLRSLRAVLDHSDMMAYLSNMTVRLIELRRTLKPTGALFLHCDPTASHYLKILLDGIFGPTLFRNEIVWQRSTGKSLMTRRLPTNHDVILFYAGVDAVWNDSAVFVPYDPENLPEKTARKYCYSDTDGRRYHLDSLINPNRNRPNLTYEFKGVTRVWRWTRERMERANRQGLIVQTAPGRVPRLKRYLDEQRGLPLGDVWTDIAPLNSQARERLGYPTQKPIALLDRIIRAASNEGDVVLDPFCGCGTSVHAAEALQRHWIGIDVTHYAVTLIESRLRRHFENVDFEVFGRPRDLDGAKDLAHRDPYQFQWWANWLVGVQNYHEAKKGRDRGVDGTIFFRNGPYGTGRVIVSVKGGDALNPGMVRDLAGTVDTEDAELGLLVTLGEPTAGMKSAAAGTGFVATAHGKLPKIQVATVGDILDGRNPKLPPPYQVSPEERLPRRASRRRTKTDQLSLPLQFAGGKAARGKGQKEYLDPRFAEELGQLG